MGLRPRQSAVASPNCTPCRGLDSNTNRQSLMKRPEEHSSMLTGFWDNADAGHPRRLEGEVTQACLQAPLLLHIFETHLSSPPQSEGPFQWPLLTFTDFLFAVWTQEQYWDFMTYPSVPVCPNTSDLESLQTWTLIYLSHKGQSPWLCFHILGCLYCSST